MKILLGLMIAVVGWALVPSMSGAADKEKENKFPDAIKTVLEKATELEIYSIDPTREQKDNATYHGYKVFGKTTVKDADKRKEILAAVDKGLTTSKGGARCFIPRHAIRAVYEGKTVDLLICFQCSWIYIYVDNKDKSELVLTTGSDAQELLNKILTDANVKLAPKDKD